MISPWQLSTWHVHGSLIEILKSKCKICQQKFISHPSALPDTHLHIFSISVNDTTSAKLFKLETGKSPLVLPFLTRIFYLSSKPSPKYISNSSTLLHCFSLGHHHPHLDNNGFPSGLLSTFLFPSTHSSILYMVVFFFTASMPTLLLTFLC